MQVRVLLGVLGNIKGVFHVRVVFYHMETKTCSKCKNEKLISDFHFKNTENRSNSWCKICVYEKQKLRWKDRKRKLVELLGGKCKLCGYDRNLASMHFHHLDPNLKDPEFKNFKELSWSNVVKEISKCTLLCANCHGEIHNPDCNLFETGHANRSLQSGLTQTGQCPTCDTKVYGTVFCSVPCAKMARRKVERPNAADLQKLIIDYSFVKIGNMYGVSDNAVRKWCKFYGIKR